MKRCWKKILWATLQFSQLFASSLLQQQLCIPMHACEFFGDDVLRAILLLRQPFDPPDLGEEPADLLLNVPAVLLAHGQNISVFSKPLFHFTLFAVLPKAWDN
ncbi:MAG TPA: hypothetical protein PKK68_04215 [Methanothrix soehngenii]|nr:hypothetical protein [Methanothrix soehngenii]